MLEVCFSDPVKATLVIAQNCRKQRMGGAFGVITDKKGLFAFFVKRKMLKEHQKRQLELQKQAVPLGGKRGDVVGLSFVLSEGDIQAPLDVEDCPRKDHIRAIFSFDPHHEQENMETATDGFWTACMNDLQKLQANPPQIRIWLDGTPDAQCGLRFVADLLKGSKSEIRVVELPQRIIREDQCIVEYCGWGEVEAERYGTFLDKEKVLTEKEVAELANEWTLLKLENSLLRVVENGSVRSVDRSYYDNRIREVFPKGTCKIAYIIGTALGKQRIPTGDIFIANRIQHFIDSGELAVLDKTEDGFYGTMVKAVR